MHADNSTELHMYLYALEHGGKWHLSIKKREEKGMKMTY